MSRTGSLLLGATAALLAGLAPARGELPTLIPRSVLFGNPTKASPRISPDGKRLSYLAPDKNDVLQVWVQTVGKNDAKQVTADKKRGIRIHQWAYQPHTLVYLQDNDGDENYHIYAVNVADGKEARDLTPYKPVKDGEKPERKFRAQLLGTHRDYPEQLLVGLNKEDPRVFDVYRVNLKTGDVKLDTKNPGNVVGWSTDTKFQVRIATIMTADGGMELRHRDDAKSEWKKLLKWGPEDTDGGVVSFSKDNKHLWLLTSEGRDTLSLVKRDLETGKEKLIAASPKADAAGVILNPKTYEV